jgi:hypothetical protein
LISEQERTVSDVDLEYLVSEEKSAKLQDAINWDIRGDKFYINNNLILNYYGIITQNCGNVNKISDEKIHLIYLNIIKYNAGIL